MSYRRVSIVTKDRDTVTINHLNVFTVKRKMRSVSCDTLNNKIAQYEMKKELHCLLIALKELRSQISNASHRVECPVTSGNLTG